MQKWDTHMIIMLSAASVPPSEQSAAAKAAKPKVVDDYFPF